jgi:hypothetical protein
MIRPDWTATMCQSPRRALGKGRNALQLAINALILAVLRMSELPQRFEAFLIRNVVGLICGCLMLLFYALLAWTLIVGKWP